MAGVWIISETREQALELLGVGRSMAPDLGTALTAIVRKEAGPPDEYIARGADEVLLLPELPPDQPFGAFLPVIEQEAKAGSPDLILFNAIGTGKGAGRPPGRTARLRSLQQLHGAFLR